MKIEHAEIPQNTNLPKHDNKRENAMAELCAKYGYALQVCPSCGQMLGGVNPMTATKIECGCCGAVWKCENAEELFEKAYPEAGKAQGVLIDHERERYQEYMDKYRENKRKKERGHREKLLSSIEKGKDAISNKPEQSSLDYMLYGLLIQCAEVLKKQEWNTITEDEDGNLCGLPPEDGDYFFYDGKYVWKDEYHNYGEDGITLNLAYDMSEVKAWMYIPEPPEE